MKFVIAIFVTIILSISYSSYASPNTDDKTNLENFIGSEGMKLISDSKSRMYEAKAYITSLCKTNDCKNSVDQLQMIFQFSAVSQYGLLASLTDSYPNDIYSYTFIHSNLLTFSFLENLYLAICEKRNQFDVDENYLKSQFATLRNMCNKAQIDKNFCKNSVNNIRNLIHNGKNEASIIWSDLHGESKKFLSEKNFIDYFAGALYGYLKFLKQELHIDAVLNKK